MYQKEIKQGNENIIFHSIYFTEDSFSIPDLTKITNMTFPTVKRVVNEFLEKDIIVEWTLSTGGVGRRAVKYKYNPDFCYSIGVSINEEKIKKWEEDCLQAEKDGNKKPKKPTITEVKDMIIPVDEQPYKLPDSWVWVRLGDISELISGYAFDSHDFKIKGDFQVLRLGNVKDNFLVLDKQPVFVEKVVAEKANKCLCFENDILVTMTGTRNKRDYFFSTKISQNQKFYFNQRVGCIRCDNLKISNYIYYILKVKFILDQIL